MDGPAILSLWVVAFEGEPIWKTTAPSREESALAFVSNSGLTLSKGDAIRYFEHDLMGSHGYSCFELSVVRARTGAPQ